MISLRYFILLIIFTGACRQNSTSLTDAEKKMITKEVQQTLHDYHTDIRLNGLMAEFNYLDSTSDFFWVPPGSAISISYDSIYKVLSENAPLYKSVNNVWDTLKINPLNQELALYTGRLSSTVTDTAGQVFIMRLVETGVMIKRNAGWKLLSGQTSFPEVP